MKDEEYAFITDVIDKKIVGRCARNRRAHTGKGRKVRLPSGNLSKKELQKMNGEVKSYRLNEPMTWKEFKKMPDDLRVLYIKMIRNKYNAPDLYIGDMMGVHKSTFIKEMARLNLSLGKQFDRHRDFDKEGFLAWCHGVPAPVKPEAEVALEEVPEENEVCEAVAEPEVDAALFGQSVPKEEVPMEGYKAEAIRLKEENDNLLKKIAEMQDYYVAMEEHNSEIIRLGAEAQKWKGLYEGLKREMRTSDLELDRLKAQMDIVYLIFGGRKDG